MIARWIFFWLVLKPLALIVLGLNVRRKDLLPAAGPAILVANHNSHLDTAVLISLFPFGTASKIRPVAAADYFLRSRWLGWFATNIMQIIPVDRGPGTAGPGTAGVPPAPAGQRPALRQIDEALERKEIILLFPEGTRGEPERLADFKSGIAHIARHHPQTPVIPIFLHGLGKALPRGESLLVPFFCDVFIGEPIFWSGDRQAFMQTLRSSFDELAAEGHFAPWE